MDPRSDSEQVGAPRDIHSLNSTKMERLARPGHFLSFYCRYANPSKINFSLKKKKLSFVAAKYIASS